MGQDTKLLLESTQKCYFPARFVLSFLLFGAMFLEYAHRVCLSVTIVAMVNHTALDIPNNTLEEDDTCKNTNSFNNTLTDKQGKYLWSPYIQGMILGAYFYGYICSQIVGGRISEMAGGKWPLGFSIFFASLLTLATPLAAELGVPAIIILRVIMGLLHGVCLPTAFALLAQWAPLEERNTHLSISLIGNHVGTMLTMPLAGFLCEYGFSGGWPSVYYTLGIVGCIWFAFWACFAYNTPSDHPRISNNEFKYIRRGSLQMTKDQKLPIPWKDILRSIPVWTVAISLFTSSWTFFTLLTELPTYLQVVQHIPIQKNGLINSMIYLCACVTLFLSGYTSDYLRTKKHFSATKVRKSFQIISLIGPAVCLVLIPIMGCNSASIIAILNLAMGFQGFRGGGDSSITADMAPHHSATLFGFVNSIGCTSGIFAPMIAGVLLEKGHSSIQQWGYVFYISASLNIAGGIVFLLFASSERQPWAYVPETEKIKGNKNIDKLNGTGCQTQDLSHSKEYGAVS